MTNKSKTTKEAILEAALAMIDEGGWDSVSARSLAEALGSSTMPIYTAIGSMDSLRAELAGRALALLESYQARPWTGQALFDKGVGYVAFAREHGRLFKFMFDAPGARGLDRGDVEASAESNGIAATLRGMLDGWSPEQLGDLTFNMWIFTHGLATLAADGILGLGDGELVMILEQAGGAFYAALGGRST